MNNLIAYGLISLVKSLDTRPIHLTTREIVLIELGDDLEWKISNYNRTLTISCGLPFYNNLNMTPLIALIKLSARY